MDDLKLTWSEKRSFLHFFPLSSFCCLCKFHCVDFFKVKSWEFLTVTAMTTSRLKLLTWHTFHTFWYHILIVLQDFFQQGYYWRYWKSMTFVKFLKMPRRQFYHHRMKLVTHILIQYCKLFTRFFLSLRLIKV